LALTSMKAGKGPAARRRRRQAKKEDSGTPRSWQNRATGRPLASCSSMTSRQRARADSDRLLMPPIFAAAAERGEMWLVQRTPDWRYESGRSRRMSSER
jgi:hypothetical protein